jgi:hypothetical protein
MFEKLADIFSKEILPLSKGQLNCLPYSRALLDFFELRGKSATPLVVRCVVLGRTNPIIEWWLNTDILLKAISIAKDAPKANAIIKLPLRKQFSTSAKTVEIPYRTLGFSHTEESGNKTLGSYEGGAWLGHLVVVCENSLIDLTVGQLNDPLFSIDITPPYVTMEVDDDFLTGRRPSICVDATNGTVAAYFAFPDERTYETSYSWTNKEFRKQLQEVAKNVTASFKGQPDTSFHIQEPPN